MIKRNYYSAAQKIAYQKYQQKNMVNILAYKRQWYADKGKYTPKYMADTEKYVRKLFDENSNYWLI
tara:strand:- start:214 stop:411 length:198 start_codon:yes stop_codon:yes gene_type:complete